MAFLGELRVEARRENLVSLAYFVHSVRHRLELHEDLCADVELAVEEAATNIISYAYPPNQPGDLLLRAETLGEILQFTLGHWGAPFDPDQVAPFDIDAPIESRVTGGLGLQLIRSLMDEVRFVSSPAPGLPHAVILTQRIRRQEAAPVRAASTRALDALQTVSEVMATSINLDDLLQLIVEKLVEAIDASRGTLYLIDEARGELYSKVLQEDTGVLKEIRVKIGEGIAGHVAATGEVLNIRDAYNDPRFNRAIDRASGFHTQTVLTAPVRNPKQKIIGVVQVLNKKGGPFSARDERMLVAMAAQAAISIENARLHAQEIRQQLLAQELRTASAIQESFLPSSVPQHPGWEIAAFWRPVHDVAGDFYDFQPLADGRWAFTIADVSGKGVPAALFMALSVTVLRFAVSFGFSVSQLLHHTNRSLISFNHQSQMFASIFTCYVDFSTGALEYSSAGHNPPLLCRARDGSCEWVRVPGIIAGMFDDIQFEQRALQLHAGDVLVLYTDGLTEAVNATTEEFGEGRLQALVQANAARSAAEIARALLEAVTVFTGDRGAFDDETLVVIKRVSAS
jgi:sigma-B regulation protein RsbU (phosphoserine phosphatase)